MRGLLPLILVFLAGHAVAVTVPKNTGFSGSFSPIPPSIQKKMQGYTWHKGCPFPLNRFVYLTMSYWGFDHQPHVGHMIILNQLGPETLSIFRALYKIHFPIEKMQLPYVYKSKDDWPSTEANNSVGFFCRLDQQTLGKFSSHSFGIAIDLNPRYNPSQVASKRGGKNITIQPLNGKQYFQQHFGHEGMIEPGDKVVRIFAAHGWMWGGYWGKPEVDYMHFQKEMDRHYKANRLIFTASP